ncbi:class I SAM-dependent methyltransferase [Actinoplanes sp. NPDC049802]|uniref:class I SAM-dependent methyltransferase n=1 Tax=Actinoplanes sp. NPDC049802 TaxID=3154742 RepID=UPI0033EC257F
MQDLFNHHGHGYDRLTRTAFGRLHARVLDDAAVAAPVNGVVLDVGAGPGRVAVALARRRPDLTVYAVDISPSMVEQARQRATAAGVADRVHVSRADVADLPLADASVDLAVSSVSFHHWADVPAAVRELRRVIRPTGYVWIYDGRIAPWARLAQATAAPVPRTRAGWAFVRAQPSLALVPL